jgi:hypothetical protein
LLTLLFGQAASIGAAKALYDYTRQTDEELSFAEDAPLHVYDTTDPDWTLVGAKGEYGFAPANYIEMSSTDEAPPPTPRRPPHGDDSEPRGPPTPSDSPSPVASPAAALAGIIKQRTGTGAVASRRMASPPPALISASRPQYTPDESEEEQPPPRLPTRPLSEERNSSAAAKIQSYRAPTSSVAASPVARQSSRGYDHEEPLQSPGGYHIYNIYEMVEVMGKNKKMPVTLGINVGKGVIMISAEKEKNSREWSAEKLTHYSIEGKHVFMELVRPSKSIDFHAGAKDTAHEIVSALGELAGAARSAGLREVFAAASGSGQKRGKMIYEFMSQGDDEVTVAEGDEVVVLDDSKSDEWWVVRRIKNGKEGVVPSSYVDIIGTVSPMSPPSSSGLNAGKSFVQQNREEEERVTKQALKKKDDSLSPTSEVGPGLQLPKRHSSLFAPDDTKKKSSHKHSNRDTSSRTSDRNRGKSGEKSLPNPAKIRTWTDRSGSFKVEAEFIALREEKIHLHKLNGIKIAVPVIKMALEDLEFVEREEGVSLDEFKPLSDIVRKNSTRQRAPHSAGAQVTKKSDYDWFDFFLQCGVDPQICERYAQAFTKDQMGEENMPDINQPLLRTLGLKEGDILRVMKFLDKKYNRQRQVSFDIPDPSGGGLFTGPGGALRDNSRKGRPAPPVETKNDVDPNIFTKKNGDEHNTALARDAGANGFDDDAWAPRESKSNSAPPPSVQPTAPAPTTVPKPSLTPGMAELSLLDTPLVPSPAPAPQPTPQSQNEYSQQQPQQTQEPPKPTGATPSLFEQLAKGPVGQQTQQAQQQGFIPQQTGFQQQQSLSVPRQRPQAPQQMQSGNNSIAPPPQRAASVPQNFQNQQSGFAPPPLQPQLTGFQGLPNMQSQIAPPGQSMQELQQQRLQQQTGFLQPQQTGYQHTMGINQFHQNGIMPQQTGYGGQFSQQQLQNMNGYTAPFQQAQPSAYGQALMNGHTNGSPFADPPRAPFQSQPTGMQQNFSPLQPQATGINSFLPPALMPQATGIQANQFSNSSFNMPPPPIPPMPQQHQGLQPLTPQKTGPPPPVRFGTTGAKKLAPQPTGRRANLSQASKFYLLPS